jgi:GT2 family glycosyltransferase
MNISVVIPCRNEKKHVVQCIHAIYECDVPKNCILSVFLVDGISDDGTSELINDLKKTYSSLQLVINEKQLTPFAFNLGIYAGGKVDYVQIVGARQIISKNYIAKCIQICQENSEIWCVGGKVDNIFENHTSKAIAEAMSTAFGMGIGNFRTLDKSGYTDTVGTPFYPYHVFEKIGFFDEELIRNQDDDFNYRVTKAGGKIYFCDEISLKYVVRSNFSNLKKQFYQYGYWKVYVNQKHKMVTSLRQLIPPIFVVFALLSIPVGLLNCYLMFGIMAVWFVYFALAFFFAIRASISSKVSFLEVMKTYLYLHFSYGFGYLKGILDFIVLQKKPAENLKVISR